VAIYKSIALKDFLTDAEIARAVKLYGEAAPGTFARRCDREIIRPILPRINAKLGQENNSRYLAYAVEFAIVTASEKKEG